MKFKFYRSQKKLSQSIMDVGIKKHYILTSPENFFEHRQQKSIEKAKEFIIFDDMDIPSKRKRKRKRKSIFASFAELVENKLCKMRPVSTAFILKLAGAFSGLLLVSAVCLCTVIFSLFIRHTGSYTTINIPNLISLDVSDATKKFSEIFEYTIVYESNPDFKEGAVIAQSPSPNVRRRLYSGTQKIKMKLTVNRGASALEIPEFAGSQARKSLLFLKNAGIEANVVEEYSDTAKEGTVISSSLPKGSKLKKGDKITLKVSLGKQPSYYLVPDLWGLSELRATTLIEASGLTVGKISYRASNKPAGTVVSQEPEYGNSLKEGSPVSFTVSGGPFYQ